MHNKQVAIYIIIALSCVRTFDACLWKSKSNENINNNNAYIESCKVDCTDSCKLKRSLEELRMEEENEWERYVNVTCSKIGKAVLLDLFIGVDHFSERCRLFFGVLKKFRTEFKFFTKMLNYTNDFVYNTALGFNDIISAFLPEKKASDEKASTDDIHLVKSVESPFYAFMHMLKDIFEYENLSEEDRNKLPGWKIFFKNLFVVGDQPLSSTHRFKYTFNEDFFKAIFDLKGYTFSIFLKPIKFMTKTTGRFVGILLIMIIIIITITVLIFSFCYKSCNSKLHVKVHYKKRGKSMPEVYVETSNNYNNEGGGHTKVFSNQAGDNKDGYIKLRKFHRNERSKKKRRSCSVSDIGDIADMMASGFIVYDERGHFYLEDMV